VRHQGPKSMNRLQIIVLGVSAVAFGGAYFVFNNYLGTQHKAPVLVAAPKVQTDQVLVAAQDIPMGSVFNETLVSWQEWPKDAISDLMIVKSAVPDTAAEFKETMTRDSFLRGEPIRRDKLVKAGIGSYMAAILPSGMRAVAIHIDNSGDSSAGGFILPNDRVDVILTKRDKNPDRTGQPDIVNAEIILSNVRVLAIDQAPKEKDGQNAVVGKTVTLELKPEQSETLARARQTGTLSLALRSIADLNVVENRAEEPKHSDSINVIRYGIPNPTTILK
jgi:pilus assembly protein CpaB